MISKLTIGVLTIITIIFIRNQIHLLKVADQQVLHQTKFQL